jgi:hypothetical protein
LRPTVVATASPVSESRDPVLEVRGREQHADDQGTVTQDSRRQVQQGAVELDERSGRRPTDPLARGQFRHTAATRLRRQFSLESAQVVLGQARAEVTRIYAELGGVIPYVIMAEIW